LLPTKLYPADEVIQVKDFERDSVKVPVVKSGQKEPSNGWIEGGVIDFIAAW
jgi:hypothetical protein